MSNSFRQMPASIESEEAAIACFFLRPKDVGCILAELNITADHFYLPAHSMIYTVAMERWISGKPVDAISVMQDLKEKKMLDHVGGAQNLKAIVSSVHSAASVRSYIEVIQEKFDLREIIRVCSEFTSLAYEDQGETAFIRAELEQKVMAIGDRKTAEDVSFNDHVMRSIKRAQEAYERNGALLGISTGLKTLDAFTSGLIDTDFIVISGETGGGKTALLMRFLESVSITHKHPAALFSFEMTNDQLTDRLMAGNSSVDLLKYRNGSFAEPDYPRVSHAAGTLAAAKIWLCDESDINIMQLRAKARRWKRRYGIRMIGVDYAQLVPPTVVKGSRNREQEVAEISRNLKAMAKELCVPVVVLSQLNDEGRMRESRALAHDANTVLMIQTEESNGFEKHFIKIAKNRNGPCGRIQVSFIKQFARFEDCAQDEPEEEAPARTPYRNGHRR